MATPTTTLRLPVDLRDEISRIAAARGTTMLDVVADAVGRLSRDQWWQGVHDAIDGLDDESLERYGEDARSIGSSTADGLQ